MAVRITESFQPLFCLLAFTRTMINRPVDSNDRHYMLLGDREQLLVLHAALSAPGTPHIYHVNLPFERSIANDGRRIDHIAQRKFRRRLADERRRQWMDSAFGIQA